jgi:hypothetical protein
MEFVKNKQLTIGTAYISYNELAKILEQGSNKVIERLTAIHCDNKNKRLVISCQWETV